MKKLIPFILFIVLCVIGCGQSHPGKKQTDMPIKEVSAEESKPENSDKELFMNYYNDLLKKVQAVDDTYNPFVSELQKRDWVGAAKICKKNRLKITRQWQEVEGFPSPDLRDSTAGKDMEEGHLMLASSCHYEVDNINQFIDLMKGSSSIVEKVSYIQDNNNKQHSLLISGLGKILSAGSQLGITNEELLAKKLTVPQIIPQK